MLKCYMQLREIIDNELMHLKLRSLILSDQEFESIKVLVETLDIVEVGSRKLCRRKVTLASADEIFEFMLRKLYKLKSPIGQQLYKSVEFRINERRNKTLATLQAFLEDHEFLEQIELDEGMKMLEYADKTELKKLASEVYNRLFLNSEVTEVDVTGNPDNPGKI